MQLVLGGFEIIFMLFFGKIIFDSIHDADQLEAFQSAMKKGTSASPKMSPKKVLFKEFAFEHKSKLSEKYPFLTNQQIQVKLQQLWKKACQRNKEMVIKSNRSPRKSSKFNPSPAKDEKSPKIEKSLYRATGSPFKSACKDNLPLDSPCSGGSESFRMDDSGPWYDEVSDSVTSAGSTDEKFLPTKTQENFTEETVKGVVGYELDIEAQNSSKNEPNITCTKTENIVSELFLPSKPSQEHEEICTVQGSRLLSSEEKGESNFNIMFSDDEEIFI